MSSVTPSRKRALSVEQTPESPERDAKKIRVSTTPTTSRGDKKRRRKKKRTAPVVGEKPRRTVDTPASTDSAKPSSLASVDRTHDAQSNQPVASSSSSNEGSHGMPVLERLTSAAQVERLLSPAPSPSSLSKGKECVTSRPPSPKAQELDLEAQIADLKNQLALQKTQLDNHSETVSTLQQSLMCQICVDLMYKPYALAPCGHLVCYDCLVRWFKTPSANDLEGEIHNPLHKRKTCPHCRAVVRQRPVEVFGIKDMVSALTKSGLAAGLPPHEEPAAPGAATDPWEGIFRKHVARNTFYIDDEGLPGPWLDNDQQDGTEVMGIYDAEDNVYRCADCLHEIFEGACSDCGRVYAGFGEPIDLDDLDDEEDEVGFNLLANELTRLGMMFNPEDDDDDDLGPLLVDDEEDAGYESSFIDDDDAADAGAGHDLSVIDLAGSEEDNDDDIENTSPVRQPARASGHARRVVVVVSSDEDDDSEVSPPPRATGRRRTARNTPGRRTLDENEGSGRDSNRIIWDTEEDDSGPENRFVSPVRTDEEGGSEDGSVSLERVVIMEDPSDDDEEEEEDH